MTRPLASHTQALERAAMIAARVLDLPVCVDYEPDTVDVTARHARGDRWGEVTLLVASEAAELAWLQELAGVDILDVSVRVIR